MAPLIKQHYKKHFICKECRIEMKTLSDMRAHFVTEHWKVENPNNIDECSEVKPNQWFTRFDPVNCVLLKPRVY